jgi:hypothetical protein
MSLSALIQKRDSGSLATATPATFAIHDGENGRTVATVANPENSIPVPMPDTPATSWRWHLHFVDRNPLIVSFSPEASHAEVLEMYPSAIAAEPLPDTPAATGQPVLMTPDRRRL